MLVRGFGLLCLLCVFSFVFILKDLITDFLLEMNAKTIIIFIPLFIFCFVGLGICLVLSIVMMRGGTL